MSEFKYGTNRIKTRKYTTLTFLPRALYIQFLRLANIYFLIIAILTSFDEISPLGPVSSILPLVFVLTTAIIREGIEDFARFKNDKITNNRKVSKYDPSVESQYRNIRWRELRVGDIVKIEKNEEFPADLVILDSSDENGVCYVETANLDGEKNLKLKSTKFELRENIKRHGMSNIKGTMLIDEPNGKIYKFKGVAEFEGIESTLYLNSQNIVLKGTFLKNTDHIIGMVVYGGHDTKIMRNMGVFRNKVSQVETQLNKFIFIIFIFQILLCILLASLAVVFYDKYQYGLTEEKGIKITYLFPNENDLPQRSPVAQGFMQFATFIILLNTLIPISLMVSLEVVKSLQSLFMYFDDLLFVDGKRLKVLNMLIHEDLAKIDYIFADKTGTLTTNEMKFIRCSINKKVHEADQLRAIDAGSDHFKDQIFRQFWLSIALCHDVVIDTKFKDSKPRERYQGSSPDEVELISMAAETKVIFQEKIAEILVVNCGGDTRKYRLIQKIDFSSDRKRMSVVVRDLSDQKLYLYSKGADSVILKRLKPDTPVDIMDDTKEHLKQFSRDGLRTLAIGFKELEEEAFIKWNEKYADALLDEYNVLSEEDPKKRVHELEDELEQNLTLLGATGLEDRLQEGVADTIKDLHKADFKIWMLTGDKLETAENIGYSTNLISKSTKVFKIRATTKEQTKLKLQKIQKKIKAFRSEMETPTRRQPADGSILSPSDIERDADYDAFALIIDGDAINFTINEDSNKADFLALIPEFRTVICCRSTPNQKAQVVSFVRHNLKKRTLAIGDGGNDVSMIKIAHIGVGIFGKEGNQAAFAADYAFTRFYHLWRLLLVHGRWSYRRITYFINFFFYKNLVFTLQQHWYALYSGYSGQSIFDDLYISQFNTTVTSVGPISYSVLEQDVNPKEGKTIRKALPYLYKEMRTLDLFSFKVFVLWCTMAILHSIIIFYFTMGIYNETSAAGDGRMYGLWFQSIANFSAVFGTVFGAMFMGTRSITKVTFFNYFFATFCLYFPAGTFIIDEIGTVYIQNIFVSIIETPRFWLGLILTFTSCLLLMGFLHRYLTFFRPNLADMLMKYRNSRRRIVQKEIAAEKKDDSSSGSSNTDEKVDDVKEQKALIETSNFEDLVIKKKSKYYDKI